MKAWLNSVEILTVVSHLILLVSLSNFLIIIKVIFSSRRKRLLCGIKWKKDNVSIVIMKMRADLLEKHYVRNEAETLNDWQQKSKLIDSFPLSFRCCCHNWHSYHFCCGRCSNGRCCGHSCHCILWCYHSGFWCCHLF